MPTITNFGDVVTQGNTTCQQRLSVQGTSTFVGAAGFSSLTAVTGTFTASANAAILNVSSGSYLTTLNVSSTSNMASLNVVSANAQSLFASSAQISNSNIQSLNVSSENVTTINISGTAWSAAFVGPGSGLSSLNASNINAGALLGTYLWGNTVSNVNASNVAIGALAAIYLQTNQTNVTSVGTLTSLAVTGSTTTGWFVGSGNTLSNVNASNVIIGALAATNLQNNQTNITSVGTLSSLAVTNGLTAGWHVGGANTLSNVNASNISYGILNSSLITGNTISNVNASNVAFGTLNGSWILGNTLSNVNASNIASGTLTLTTPITGSLFVGAGNALSNVSGVGAGTYGSAGGGQYPLITVDASGRITSITNQGVQGTQWSGSTGDPIYYNQNYVGIGTANPLTALDVRGNAYVLGNLATWYTQTATLGAELIYSIRNASTTVSGTSVTIAVFDTTLLPPGVTGTVYLKYNAPGTGSVYFVKNGSKLYNLATSEAVFIGGVSSADGSAQLTLKFSGTGSITFTDFYFVADVISVTSNTSVQGNVNASGSITAPVFIGGGNVLSNIQASNVNGTIVVTQISGGGNTISNLNASNITYGNLLGSWILGNTLSNINVSNISGYVTANVLSNINASNIAFGAIAATYLQNNQGNINSVGTLTSLAVTGAATAGWHIGGANTLSNVNASNVAIGALATTYLQNNQTNITSVGTLTTLSVTGNTNAGWFVGGANTLSNINASNIVSTTTLTLSTLLTASQFSGAGNTLSNIQASSVNGTIVVTQIAGGGNTLSNLNASNIAFGNLLGSWVLGNTLSNINAANIAFGNAPALSVTGNLTAGWFVGGANTLSNINASNIAFGNAPSLSVTGNLNAGWFVGGANTLSNINASNIAFGNAPSLSVTGNLNAGWFVGSANTLSNINASNIAFGNAPALSVTGNLSAGWFIGSANTVSNINASNIAYGNLNGSWVLGNTLSNINASNIAFGNAPALSVTGNLSAGWFVGSANTLSNINAANIAFGNAPALSVTGNLNAGWHVGGANTLSNINASNIAFGNAPALSVTGNLNAGWFVGSANTLSNINASNIAFGNAPALSVTGNLNAGWFVGGANTLSNINASNIAFGNLLGSWVLGNTLSNLNASNIAFGNAPALSVTGNLTAGWFVGGANTLSNINAANIAFGNAPALSVTGNLTAGWLVGSANTLSNINAANIAFGNAPALSVTGNLNAGWHVGGANTLSNINASNIAFGNAPALSVTGNLSAGWFVGGGNTLSNVNASNIAIGALSSSQLQSTQANISAIGTVGTGLTVSGPLGITNLVITGGSTPTVGQYLQATSTGGALTWATVTTGGVTGNTISNINASNVVLGYFGNILTLANTASWFDLPAYMNVYQVYQTRAGSISVSGASFATALTFNNSLYVPPGVVGKMVVVYSTGSGTLQSSKTNSTYVLSAGGGRIEIPNLSAGDSDPLLWSLRYFGGTTSSITYTDLWFEAYSTQIMSSNVVFGNAAASYTNVVMYSNLTVNGSIQSLVDASASNAMTVGTGIRLYGANSTIISTTAVATANLNATNGAVICAFPTRKFYSWSGTVTSSSAPTFTLTFANYAFYTKIVAILMDTSGTVNSVSTLSIEAAGGSADGTTPSNSIVIGSKNLFGPTLTNPWSATVTTSATTIVLVPTNSSFYLWQISAEVIGSSAALNTLAQSANPATSKTFNY